MKGEGTVEERTYTVALAGNPNVGKSTVFNSLTGLHQHTGNWAGKTVSTARGFCRSGGRRFCLVDLPGTYSLTARSAEEEAARDFLCFGGAEAVMVVCDATCLERNLNLVLQCMELKSRVLVCVNLMDEARKKGISLDLPELSRRLGAPVLGVSARDQGSREALLKALDDLVERPPRQTPPLRYPPAVEAALSRMAPLCPEGCGRFLCLRLLAGEPLPPRAAALFASPGEREELLAAVREERETLGIDADALEDLLTASLVQGAELLCRGLIRRQNTERKARDRAIDRWITGRLAGYPLMLLLLALVFYLTIRGANAPSQWLSATLFSLEGPLDRALLFLGAPSGLRGLLVQGAYRVLAWVVAVMLPPMAIFFPLFTLLEDAGYLPRVAYLLDRPFHRCGACGKQALCMCMGFGCNAAGVVGCRIIDSPRERLLAMLTNSLVPCNGRFPLLIALLGLFFSGEAGQGSLRSALLLTAVVCFSVLATFAATRLLSATLLRGSPSAFVLELPPYRPPQVGRVLLRSLLDRTVFVLGRAAAVAAPAGALLWWLANTGGPAGSPLLRLAAALDPAGRFFGLDGAILTAFLLGLPANETVLPILLMIYTAQGSLTEPGSLSQVGELLLQNGWTGVTALCVLLFTVLHWPCSTTLLSIRRETGGWRWAALAAVLPTAMGLSLCAVIAGLARLISA